MSDRNVIVLGLAGSGKSWLLNNLLGRKEFDEGTRQNTLTIVERSKTIRDNVNNLEYKLNLHDTPGLDDKRKNRREILDEILNKLRQKEFHQIIIVCNFGQLLEDKVQKYHEILALCLQECFEKSVSSITLIINRVGVTAKDEDITGYREKLVKLLGLDSNECICIQQNETPRDCVFRYLIYSREDGYQFQDRNILAIIGQSKPAPTESIKTLSEKYADAEEYAKSKPSIFLSLLDFLFRMIASIILSLFKIVSQIILCLVLFALFILAFVKIGIESSQFGVILITIIVGAIAFQNFIDMDLKTPFSFSPAKTHDGLDKNKVKKTQQYYEFLNG